MFSKLEKFLKLVIYFLRKCAVKKKWSLSVTNSAQRVKGDANGDATLFKCARVDMVIGRTNNVKFISAHLFQLTAQNMEVLIPSSGALHHIFSPQFQRDSGLRILFNLNFSF